MAIVEHWVHRLMQPRVAKYAFVGATLLKVTAYVLFVFGGGVFWTSVSDANLYDAIANGDVHVKNAWGQFLRVLHELGLYSRPYLSAIIFTANCIAVPWFYTKLYVPADRTLVASDWYVLLLVALYPTLSFFSTDIYRDVPMVILFFGALYAFQHLCERSPKLWLQRQSWLLWILGGVCLYALFKLRFYLAASLLIAFVASYVLDITKRMWLGVVLYFLILYVADAQGIFNWMKIKYRLTYAAATTSYAIDFSQGLFLVNFVKSFLHSIYGLYFNGLLSILLFVVESVPALGLTAYVLFNKKYANQFIAFLIFFFFIYSGIWTIGVDALGTAIRYRIFSYLAILLAAYLIHQRKKESLESEAAHD